MSTQLILVGGFLGSGKTTLLQHAAERLRSEGRQIGLVTNDQAANLVDTSLLQACQAGVVGEVAGGCFCCRFPDLVTALADLVERGAPDTILCEPVGSCTDVSATVLQPLKKLHGDRYRLTPYTVLLDPRRTGEALGQQRHSNLPDNVLYIFRKQVEEADLLVINKADITPADTIEQCRRLLNDVAPDTPVLTMSALIGTGISEWLSRLEGLGGSGQRIADVDYDVYADGEAALGWLNAKVHLAAESPVNWHEFAHGLMSLFWRELRRHSAEIAHVKFRLTTGQDTLTANLTGSDSQPSLQGRVDTSRRTAQLLFNARVHIGPDQLQEVLENSLAQAAEPFGITAEAEEMSSFAPARPQPTHRFPAVVA